MLVKFGHVHVGVSNLDRSLDFYGNKLGLKTTKIMDTMGSVSLGTASLVLDKVPAEKLDEFRKQEKNVVIAFSVDDVEKYFKEIKARGVQTLDEPTKRSWGSYNFYLKDLDSYTIEVEQEG